MSGISNILPVAICSASPAQLAEQAAARAKPGAIPSISDIAQGGDHLDSLPDYTSATFDWAGVGLDPRWIGEDSAPAIAVIEPSMFGNTGGPHTNRFLQGCAHRSELPLAISTVGSLRPRTATHRSLLLADVAGSAVAFTHHNTSIVAGRPVRLSALPELASGLAPADRDLALRIRNRAPELPWWPLSLSAGEMYRPGSPHGGEPTTPDGALIPLLVSNADEILAGVWQGPNGERQYVLPAITAWRPVLDWLAKVAVPTFNPTAAGRTRSGTSAIPDLQTPRERAATTALQNAEQRWETEREGLTRELESARAEGEAVRNPLLFGTKDELVDAVEAVLTSIGVECENLDRMFGDTISADLLVTEGQERVLVEVKGINGRPGEDLVDDLRRHLRTWPALRPLLPVTRGVLVVNHQRSTPVLDRVERPYDRPEFLAGLECTVVGSRQLFDAWTRGDRDLIHSWLFGAGTSTERSADPPAETIPVPVDRPRTGRFFNRG